METRKYRINDRVSTTRGEATVLDIDKNPESFFPYKIKFDYSGNIDWFSENYLSDLPDNSELIEALKLVIDNFPKEIINDQMGEDSIRFFEIVEKYEAIKNATR